MTDRCVCGSMLSHVADGEIAEIQMETVDGGILLDGPLFGDANCDGMVTAADAALILRSIVGLNTLSPRGALCADVDGDGEVTAADAAMILRYVVCKIDVFTAEEP